MGSITHKDTDLVRVLLSDGFLDTADIRLWQDIPSRLSGLSLIVSMGQVFSVKLSSQTGPMWLAWNGRLYKVRTKSAFIDRRRVSATQPMPYSGTALGFTMR